MTGKHHAQVSGQTELTPQNLEDKYRAALLHHSRTTATDQSETIPRPHATYYHGQHEAPAIVITHGGVPTPAELAALTAIMSVLSGVDAHIHQTVDRWPSPQPDAMMRPPFGTFHYWRTNLRCW